jgi:N-acetylneuraminate synthase
LYELYQEAHTPWEWHPELFACARELGITIFSSPFDRTAIDFLVSLEAPAFKIASFEATDLPLIRYAARTGRPLIISTGMADSGEIGEALAAAQDERCRDIILLHCVSGYPSPASESNVRTIPAMEEQFRVPIGLSDHTHGVAVPIAAVAMGACVIEKHFTLRRADGGPDAAFSLEPEELKVMCDGVRTAWDALGCVNFERTESERGSMIFRRSLYVVRDIA